MTETLTPHEPVLAADRMKAVEQMEKLEDAAGKLGQLNEASFWKGVVEGSLAQINAYARAAASSARTKEEA